MPFLPIDPAHAQPVPRDDDYADFAILKAKGEVRDKRGNVIKIDKPHSEWSARQRDELYQAFCLFAKTNRNPEVLQRWVEREAAQLGMSPKRAEDIINQGNGEWSSPNSRWWRGVSA